MVAICMSLFSKLDSLVPWTILASVAHKLMNEEEKAPRL